MNRFNNRVVMGHGRTAGIGRATAEAFGREELERRVPS